MAYEKVEREASEEYPESTTLRTDGDLHGLEITATQKLSQEYEGNYGPYRWVNGQKEDGEHVGFRANKILLERLLDARYQVGDKLKIETRMAEPKNAGGRKYRSWTIWVDRKESRGEFDPSPEPPAPDATETPKDSFDKPPF